MKYNVVIADDRHAPYDIETEVLAGADAAVQVCNRGDASSVADAVRNADGVLVNLFPIPADIVRQMVKCRVISRYGIGYDNVDVDAATAKRIWVANVPDYGIEDVSDHALALLLACVRRIPYKDAMIREGHWFVEEGRRIHRIKGRVLGLVGFGAIARALCRKVSGLGLDRVLAYDPYVPADAIRDLGAQAATLPQLLQSSDFISVHAPLTDETRGMIGRSEIDQMKPGAILINTARGLVLVESEIAIALGDGRLAYAGLDVFQEEPLPASSPLRQLENVILTDHAAWGSAESVIELKQKAAMNVAHVLRGEKPLYPLNEV